MEAAHTNGGRLMARGYTFDPEDSRTTNRLRDAYVILRTLGIEPTKTHSDYMGAEYGRPKHICTDGCKIEWPVWVTSDMLDYAYSLADRVATERGNFNRTTVGV
jgi:hypothetical protein